jgi:glycosyltransferase involved in cell wall biosynthesis
MKIAQVAPLAESVPPKLYGGTERIVSFLTEELVERGHDVTLFASGDSLTNAELVAPCKRALRLDPAVKEALPYYVMMLEDIRRRAAMFDVIHFHIDLLHFPIVRALPCRTVTTLHGRLDIPDLLPFYRMFPDIPLASISYNQRQPMPKVNWLGTVHHGLPKSLLPFNADGGGGYLAFLGRISPEKRPDWAIQIAVASGCRLKIAAKIDEAGQAYWDEVVEPMVRRHPEVEFIGEINEQQKARFLGDAAAILFPIDWAEPFGLVMIEALSCGTPVIAFRRGSVPEVIENGVNGFIVDDVEEAVDAVGRLHTLSRARVRGTFEKRFTSWRMTKDYERIYRALVGIRDERRSTMKEGSFRSSAASNVEARSVFVTRTAQSTTS